MRTGIGYDSHRFAAGRKLILGGVEIPFEKGFDGHSDASFTRLSTPLCVRQNSAISEKRSPTAI